MYEICKENNGFRTNEIDTPFLNVICYDYAYEWKMLDCIMKRT